MHKSVDEQLLEMERTDRAARAARLTAVRIKESRAILNDVAIVLAQERQDAAVCLILDALELLEGS